MAVGAQRPPIEALAEAAKQVASGSELRPALAAIAAGAAEALGAELVAVRVLGERRRSRRPLGCARGVGARRRGGRYPRCAGSDRRRPCRPRRCCGSPTGWAPQPSPIPAFAGERLVGAVEVVRGEAFGEADVALAAIAAAQVGLAMRTLAPGAHAAADFRRLAWLELAGEALAAGWDAHRTGEQALRVAAAATGARAGILWRLGDDGIPAQLASAR